MVTIELLVYTMANQQKVVYDLSNGTISMTLNDPKLRFQGHTII